MQPPILRVSQKGINSWVLLPPIYSLIHMLISGGQYPQEPKFKLLISPLITPRVVPYITPYRPPFKELDPKPLTLNPNPTVNMCYRDNGKENRNWCLWFGV